MPTDLKFIVGLTEIRSVCPGGRDAALYVRHGCLTLHKKNPPGEPGGLRTIKRELFATADQHQRKAAQTGESQRGRLGNR